MSDGPSGIRSRSAGTRCARSGCGSAGTRRRTRSSGSRTARTGSPRSRCRPGGRSAGTRCARSRRRSSRPRRRTRSSGSRAARSRRRSVRRLLTTSGGAMRRSRFCIARHQRCRHTDGQHTHQRTKKGTSIHNSLPLSIQTGQGLIQGNSAPESVMQEPPFRFQNEEKQAYPVVLSGYIYFFGQNELCCKLLQRPSPSCRISLSMPGAKHKKIPCRSSGNVPAASASLLRDSSLSLPAATRCRPRRPPPAAHSPSAHVPPHRDTLVPNARRGRKKE